MGTIVRAARGLQGCAIREGQYGAAAMAGGSPLASSAWVASMDCGSAEGMGEAKRGGKQKLYEAAPARALLNVPSRKGGIMDMQMVK